MFTLTSCFHNHLLLHVLLFLLVATTLPVKTSGFCLHLMLVQLDVHVFVCECDLVVAFTTFFLPPFLLYVGCVLYIISITIVQSYTEKHHELICCHLYC